GEAEERRPAPAAWPAAPRLVRAPAREAGMSADSLARIDRAVRAALDAGVFTGAVVAVGRRGKLVKLTGYGRTGGVPVDPATTVFDIASLTKVVGTTAAVMALVEDGTVRLDAPVRRYVPQFRGDGKGGVTVRHLLTHTSGLPAGAWLYGEASNPEEALRRVLRTPLVRDPGTRVEYSDFGMILMAEIVRRRAGEPLDRFLARRVFVPLGMENTLFLPPVALQADVVPTALRSERPYVLDGVVHDGNAFRLGGVSGHAGLFSTAPDLAVYAQTLLNGGAYGARRVWQPSTVRTFTARQAGAGTRTLGWDTPAPVSSAGSYLSATAYGHTGYTGTSIWIDPARGLFVVLLTNRTYDRGTARQILDLRRAVANAAARAITDTPIRPRPGTPEAIREEQQRRRPKPAPRRPQRPRDRRRG
ncbi:MAG TPA: serine hydrolase domain-containing protein, partial [Longimicrobium sp.]|nr:serine hydrolase domain-containing protein [Longimicrobium sp.]